MTPLTAPSRSAEVPSAISTSQWTTWRFERESRYYRLHLEQDLWGTWCLTRVHGRRNNPLGRSFTTVEPSFPEACAALTAAFARRRRRGYRLVPPI